MCLFRLRELDKFTIKLIKRSTYFREKAKELTYPAHMSRKRCICFAYVAWTGAILFAIYNYSWLDNCRNASSGSLLRPEFYFYFRMFLSLSICYAICAAKITRLACRRYVCGLPVISCIVFECVDSFKNYKTFVFLPLCFSMKFPTILKF